MRNHNKDSTKKSNTAQVSFLMENIDLMAKKIQKSNSINKEEAYGKLGLKKATISNWKNGKQIPRSSSLIDLLEVYNTFFEPQIDDQSALLNRRLEDFVLKADTIPSSEYERFLGTYYLYYFSDHYQDEVHYGKLRISYTEETQKCYARMVIGFRNNAYLNNQMLNSVFADKNDDLNHAYKSFKSFKNSLKYQIDKRCYYYQGKVENTDMTLLLKMNGSEHRDSHRQNIIFPIKRINIRSDPTTGKTKIYRGGMGLAIAYPNAEHRNLRIYRIGISRWPIDVNDKNVRESLIHKTTDMNRIILSDDDDKKWYDTMLLYEAGHKA